MNLTIASGNPGLTFIDTGTANSENAWLFAEPSIDRLVATSKILVALSCNP